MAQHSNNRDKGPSVARSIAQIWQCKARVVLLCDLMFVQLKNHPTLSHSLSTVTTTRRILASSVSAAKSEHLKPRGLIAGQWRHIDAGHAGAHFASSDRSNGGGVVALRLETQSRAVPVLCITRRVPCLAGIDSCCGAGVQKQASSQEEA